MTLAEILNGVTKKELTGAVKTTERFDPSIIEIYTPTVIRVNPNTRKKSRITVITKRSYIK